MGNNSQPPRIPDTAEVTAEIHAEMKSLMGAYPTQAQAALWKRFRPSLRFSSLRSTPRHIERCFQLAVRFLPWDEGLSSRR